MSWKRNKPVTESVKASVAHDYVNLRRESGIDLSLNDIIYIKNISSIDCMLNDTGKNIIKKYYEKQLYLKIIFKKITDSIYVDFKRAPFLKELYEN